MRIEFQTFKPIERDRIKTIEVEEKNLLVTLAILESASVVLAYRVINCPWYVTKPSKYRENFF